MKFILKLTLTAVLSLLTVNTFADEYHFKHPYHNVINVTLNNYSDKHIIVESDILRNTITANTASEELAPMQYLQWHFIFDTPDTEYLYQMKIYTTDGNGTNKRFACYFGMISHKYSLSCIDGYKMGVITHNSFMEITFINKERV